MKKAALGSALVLVLALFLAPARAEAITCAQCGITSSNVSAWQAIDANGNGFLTTFDVVLFNKFIHYQGFCLTFLEDLDAYEAIHADIDGDGSWDIDDQRILNGLAALFAVHGNPTTLNLCDQLDCLRMVILGTCP